METKTNLTMKSLVDNFNGLGLHVESYTEPDETNSIRPSIQFSPMPFSCKFDLKHARRITFRSQCIMMTKDINNGGGGKTLTFNDPDTSLVFFYPDAEDIEDLRKRFWEGYDDDDAPDFGADEMIFDRGVAGYNEFLSLLSDIFNTLNTEEEKAEIEKAWRLSQSFDEKVSKENSELFERLLADGIAHRALIAMANQICSRQIIEDTLHRMKYIFSNDQLEKLLSMDDIIGSVQAVFSISETAKSDVKNLVFDILKK